MSALGFSCPGKFQPDELRFQAENIAASIVSNASFSCSTTRVLITWDKWKQRDEFFDTVEHMLDAVPRRFAYYPGAVERYREFTGREPHVTPDGKLPWTLIRNVESQQPSLLFQRESFTSICVEVPLGGKSEVDFLRRAVDFANERLWGTLCAAITVPPEFRREQRHEATLRDCLDCLRYGCIGVNHWPGMMYALISLPWGGHPSSQLSDAQSGIGWVHNSYRLNGVEKSILEGPVRTLMKPPWFPFPQHPEQLAWAAAQGCIRVLATPTTAKYPPPDVEKTVWS